MHVGALAGARPVDALPASERPAAFITALKKLIAASGLDGLKMSDYGVRREEIPALAKNARDTMGGLFEVDRYKLSSADTEMIFANAYR